MAAAARSSSVPRQLGWTEWDTAIQAVTSYSCRGSRGVALPAAVVEELITSDYGDSVGSVEPGRF